MRFIPIVLFCCILQGCLDPANIKVEEDPDLQELKSQIKHFKAFALGKRMEKKVILSGQEEIVSAVIDSSFLHYDFDMLTSKEIDMLLLAGNYEKAVEGSVIKYTRKGGEKKGPTVLSISKYSEHKIEKVTAEWDKSNFLFGSSSSVVYEFDEHGLLSGYQITRYQKLPALDASNYTVKARVIN